MYKIIHGENFAKQISKLDGRYTPLIKRFEERLLNEPFLGKPLYSKFLREKKFNGIRLIFITYPDINKILFVAIINKKDQQETIDFVKEHFEEYRELVKKL